MGQAATLAGVPEPGSLDRQSGKPGGEGYTEIMRMLNEHQCIALAQQGDRNAFAELVQRYQTRIYRFILRMSGCPDDAMDLTQETFLKAYQALATWRAEALFRTWLFRIASNTVVDHLRRKRFLNWVPLTDGMELPDQSAGPESRALADQTCAALETGLQKLPFLYREALVLREVEGMSYQEIAETLSISPGTVKSRIARARSMLLDWMQRRGHLPLSKGGERDD